MPRRLTLAQRLTTPDGAPTWLARAGVVALMAAAAAIGWAAGPDRDDSGTRSRDVVAVDRLSGDLPIPSGDERPELGSAAALPRIRSAPGWTPPPAPDPQPTPTASPAPATPEPSATPGATDVPVATPAPAPAAPPASAPTAAPSPAPTPAPTFDSSG